MLKNRTSGIEDLVYSAMMPVDSQGVKPPNFNVDNVGENQLPMSADNSFSFEVANTIAGTPTIVRIAQIASPVITHLIYCDLGSAFIKVLGANSFRLNGNVVAVLGNKLEYLGDYVAPSDFTPKQDYRQCRILSVSDNIRYNGKIIDVNGNMYTAMMQEPLELQDVSPTQIADSIRNPMTKSVTRVGQHKEPVFDYFYLDPADNPDKIVGDKVSTSETFSFTTSSSGTSFWSADAALVVTTGTDSSLYPAQVANIFQQMMDDYFQRAPTIAGFEKWFDDLDNKYGIYQDRFKTIAVNHSNSLFFNTFNTATSSEGVALSTLYTNMITAGKYEEQEVGTKYIGNSVTSGVQAFLNHLANSADIKAQMLAWMQDAAIPSQPISEGLYLGCFRQFEIRFTPLKPPSLRLDDMVPYNSTNLANILNEQEQAYFVDPHYKVAVTELTTIGDVNILVTSRIIYQLIINDKSVLAVQALRVARDPTAVSPNQLEQFVKMTRAMPPALIEGDERNQIRTRGIGGLLGNILSGLFPPAAGIMQAGGQIIDSFVK